MVHEQQEKRHLEACLKCKYGAFIRTTETQAWGPTISAVTSPPEGSDAH